MKQKYEPGALIVIDVQEAVNTIENGQVFPPESEKIIEKAIAFWRKYTLPIIFVKYISPRSDSPFNKNSPGSRLKPFTIPEPGETLVLKNFESAFMKTDLDQQLKKRNIAVLYFVGYYTDQCVAASAKSANNLGYKVYIIEEATGATGCSGHNGKFYPAEVVQQLALGGMARDGCQIINSGLLFSKFEK